MSVAARRLTYKITLSFISSSTSKPIARSHQSLFHPSLHLCTTRTMASQNLPKTMRGIIQEKTGGTEVLQYRTDLPVPVPKEGEVLIKNEYIGINYIDTYIRTGLYPTTLPTIPGREGEGTLAAFGPSTTSPTLKLHDRVIWMGNSSAYAEYSTAPASRTVTIPSGIPPSHASAAFLQGLTALSLVEEAYPVKSGETVLVHAAAGGTGLWLCQILKAMGAKVIATASSEEKRELARRNGASVTCGYGKEEVLETVRRETGGEGVHVVLDGVGKTTWEVSLEAVRRKGTVVCFGNASGAVEPISISTLTAKNVKIVRPTLYNYIYTQEEFEYYVNKLWDLMIKEKFNVRIHKIYPLEDAAKAQDDIESRGTTGKLLLKP